MRRGVVIVVGLAVSGALAAPVAHAVRPLRTAVVDADAYAAADPTEAFARTKAAGATFVRLNLNWSAVAPDVKPPDPTDPDDLGYSWAAFDLQVEKAKEAGLEPIVCIEWAPVWAGGLHPNATAFGQFARAAAIHYAGQPGGEPRVRYWQAWNEPNRDYFLKPQYSGGKMTSPRLYRSMVNKFAAAIHDVSPANRVVAGGLAPLGRKGKPAPLTFMKKLLAAPTSFDIWSHHPYTSGGPLHVPPGPGDIALGNLGKMRSLLAAKAKSKLVRSRATVQFWVTEFSWDSKPPDPKALGQPLHKRWVAEALYRMWTNGVSLVTWFRVGDDPLTGVGASPYQSGFYSTSGDPKPSLQAFRFPVVALRRKTGVVVWGRTPDGGRASVTVQVKTGSTWKKLSTLSANRAGIFRTTYKVPYRKGYVRAKTGGETSVPFSLRYARDRFVNPFGCGDPIAC